MALALVALALLGFSSAVAQTTIQPKKPAELEEFDFLLGEWVTRVDFFDENGGIRRVQAFSAVVGPILEGVVYKSRTGPEDKCSFRRDLVCLRRGDPHAPHSRRRFSGKF